MGTGAQPPAFGELLRRYRGEKGVSQEELAEQAGLSVPAISALERGVTQWPYRATVALLAEALELAPAERRALEAAARRPARRAVGDGSRAPGPSGADAAGRGGLAADMPPGHRRPAPAPAAIDTLPMPLTALVGREQELPSICTALRQADVRLLTLTGAGGIGKTRLAIQVAADLRDDFVDGVVFVALDALREPGLVPSAIARALALFEEGGGDLWAGIVECLREKRLLLLLDNAEQVVAAAPLVVELLAACPGLKVLATSRAALHVRGEREVVVPPLALPGAARGAHASTSRPGVLDGCDDDRETTAAPAVALFIERALAVRPNLAIDRHTTATIAAICARLDGLPLAIELAAARVRLLSPEALLARLNRRLELLSDGPRDLPARQQTLRGTIAWSYDLLEPREKRLFARLAIFAGTWSLEAAEAICADSEGADAIWVLEGLHSLVDKSLMFQERAEERPGMAPGDDRFKMLATIRDYALELLAASGELAAVARRHAAYYCVLVEQAEPLLRGASQVAWFACLADDHDNVRGALRWSLEAGEAETGLRIAACLWAFWYVRGDWTEALSWLEQFLAQPAPADTAQARRLRARALNGASRIAIQQGSYERAVAHAEESLMLYRELDEPTGIANTLINLGQVAGRRGDYTRATSLFDESLTLLRPLGDRWRIAHALENRGRTARLQGDDSRAAELLQESLALFRQTGDRWGIGLALHSLGDVAREAGDFGRAVQLYGESLAARRELGNKQGIAAALAHLGYVARARGEYEQALAVYEESLALLYGLGDRVGIAQCLEGMAYTVCAQGQAGRAARLLGAAAALRDIVGAPLPHRERAMHNRDVATTLTALGDRGYAEGWAAGRGLPLDETISYALSSAVPV
jgi:predicted ATPase/transcriptional regulator with XRE-family HTH domain